MLTNYITFSREIFTCKKRWKVRKKRKAQARDKHLFDQCHCENAMALHFGQKLKSIQTAPTFKFPTSSRNFTIPLPSFLFAEFSVGSVVAVVWGIVSVVWWMVVWKKLDIWLRENFRKLFKLKTFNILRSIDKMDFHCEKFDWFRFDWTLFVVCLLKHCVCFKCWNATDRSKWNLSKPYGIHQTPPLASVGPPGNSYWNVERKWIGLYGDGRWRLCGLEDGIQHITVFLKGMQPIYFKVFLTKALEFTQFYFGLISKNSLSTTIWSLLKS